MTHPNCSSCGCEHRVCRELWRRQRKCCPDCTHGGAVCWMLRARQPYLPALIRGLDLEPLLRGALLAEMAAVVMQLPEPEASEDAHAWGAPWRLCSGCGELVPNERWAIGYGTSRCRRCIRRAIDAHARERGVG